MPAPGASEATQLEVLAALLALHNDITIMIMMSWTGVVGFKLTDTGLILIPGGLDNMRGRFQEMRIILDAISS